MAAGASTPRRGVTRGAPVQMSVLQAYVFFFDIFFADFFIDLAGV